MPADQKLDMLQPKSLLEAEAQGRPETGVKATKEELLALAMAGNVPRLVELSGDGQVQILAELAQEGLTASTAAFAALVHLISPQLSGFFAVRVHDQDNVPDLVQETLLVLWDRLHTYRPEKASFRAWAKFRAGFILMNYFRERGQHRRVEAFIKELEYLAVRAGAQDELDAKELLPSRPPSPDEAVLAAHHIGVTLGCIFNAHSPPHRLVAFGYCRLLDWRPSEVDRELAEIALRGLLAPMQDYLTTRLGLPRSEVERSLQTLHQKMDRKLGTVLEKDDPRYEEARELYSSLLKRIVGSMALREYYQGPRTPGEQITRWWNLAQRSIRAECPDLLEGTDR